MFIENSKDKESIPTKNLITKVKIFATTTIILGYLCVYTLSQQYFKEEANKHEKEFIENFYNLINKLQEYFQFDSFYLLDRLISEKLVNTLIYVREKYQSKANNYNHNYNSKYICRILVDKDALGDTLSKLKIDLPGNLQPYNNTDFFAFGESEHEVKNKAKTYLKYTIDPENKLRLWSKDISINPKTNDVTWMKPTPIKEDDSVYAKEIIEDYINNLETKVNIISPWDKV
ncbi:hypothetical protein H6G20_14380 [Desertifilum sp. FACHB-1129]|uniref:Uncharacterized protein n=1 Tax=Desertifilum tharense IPPAS B-1220 TaxID=1781255 RepID=A0ACD5GYD4_9CYAN|nr:MULTISPECIES: hypothetical protein [unclassified Desertifilum]MBD2312856.1 hypothetical protein [Desertifilum sp. FACHB-1129]MBD2324220.1 hypothetical protein [Desertifilum sp. FACHB-866]MBD2334234.1 hypothetical protein [Desertifilum sp. FACHB-868]MDA0212276.1 hypothetical protein [Cyanobacteria bacterium FC1]